MSEDSVALLFLVGEHSFAGQVEHHSTRILDVLNDAQSTLLRINNAVVFPGLLGKPIAQFGVATLQKQAVDFVVHTDNHHEAPLRRKFSLVDKQPHPIFVLLANYEIRGTAMLERSVDPELLLSARASTFFPIVNATVSSTRGDTPPLSAHVAFVNKLRVSLIEIERGK